jgi:hypothetical protein
VKVRKDAGKTNDLLPSRVLGRAELVSGTPGGLEGPANSMKETRERVGSADSSMELHRCSKL